MLSILYTSILFLSISLTNAALLDGDCGTNSTSCQGIGVVCEDGKCQCNIPFYTPCNTGCEVNRNFAYESERCAVPENCVKYTKCENSKCQCIDNSFTTKNGLCLKNLKTNCVNHDECWSDYCFQSKCECKPGYEAGDSQTTCRVKLVDIYENWNEANAAGAFCADPATCFDSIAECYNDTEHPQSKFCKCPDGYKVNKDNNNRGQCDAIPGQYLSPLDIKPTNYSQCGKCEDKNAACITAAGQKTCWCRAGYFKNGNKCESRTTGIIFPNPRDVQLHDFTTGCSPDLNGTDQARLGLCVCAPYYKFDVKDRSCKKIVAPKWNDAFEYGVCTLINSKGQATGENGVCPEPLKCEARNDKHVCSCGIDKFLDVDDQSQCVYNIDKGANKNDFKCPKNAENGTNGNCQCKPGYKVIDNKRQCELKLSSNNADTSCNGSSIENLACVNIFGNTAVFCSIGECRCFGNESFSNKENNHCYALVNKIILSSSRADCPPNSVWQTNRCTCNIGYRPSGDSHECVSSNIKLNENKGPATNSNGTLTTADCQVLFKGPVEVYENDQCQCKYYGFKNEDETGCSVKLNVTIPVPTDSAFCPNNSDTAGGGGVCSCRSGFKTEGNKCVPTDQVYLEDDPAAPNFPGINDNGCMAIFGTGAKKATNGGYCICRPNIAYRVKLNTYCHFLINVSTDESKNSDTCPDNSKPLSTGATSACICEPGYRASLDNRECELYNIPLVGTENLDQKGNCSIFQDVDCTAEHGQQAFCSGDKCYCNRKLSYINAAGKCEPFSNYKFPGEHELYLYACNTNDDCGKKKNVICADSTQNPSYKVCQCQDGSLLDPKSQTCVENRCKCDETLHFECRDYVCQCKSGYIRNGSTCVEVIPKPKLYERCNQTIFREIFLDNGLVCNGICNRAQCGFGYRAEDKQCVQHQFQNDRCLYQPTICQTIDANAICSRDENYCLCGSSYYLWENKCARGVGFECTDEEQCGSGTCIAGRCACHDRQIVQETTDKDGRPIKYCINGIDQLRSNPVLLFLFLFILARVFF